MHIHLIIPTCRWAWPVHLLLLAVKRFALSCVGLEGLHTSLKPEEALIYLYDGLIVSLASVQAMLWLWQVSCKGYAMAMASLGASNCKTTHMTIVEVDKSLF